MPILLDIAMAIFKLGVGLFAVGALVGLVFAIKSQKERPFGGAYKEITVVMLSQVLAGTVIAMIAWFIAVFMHSEITLAYNGIPLIMPLEYEVELIRLYFIVPAATALLATVGFFFIRYQSRNTWRRFEVFYALFVLTAACFVLIPLALFQDLYGLLITTQLFVDVAVIGSVLIATFLYLRARIEKRYIAELLTGIAVVRRVFWSGVLINALITLANWHPDYIYQDEFVLTNGFFVLVMLLGLVFFEMVLPSLLHKAVTARMQAVATLSACSLSGVAVFALIYSTVQANLFSTVVLFVVVAVILLFALSNGWFLESALRVRRHWLW
jgi:hypothetical protein